MGPDEDMLYLRKELATKGSRVLPESPNNVFRNGTDSPMCSLSTENMLSGDGDRFVKLKLDERWIIDPKVLFVGSKLGEGAHGKVYEGKYHNVNVAVKIIQPGETPEDIAKSKSRFAREVAMLSKVQHKNLVKFIGACEEPMALVTELLSGQSLRKYLLSQRPQQMDIALAVSFALDIAQVMDCLHANGIIHRDLKPDNLLLTGDQKTVKLVDFGLAREESVTEMMTAETGTYRWMAPELYSTVTLRQGEKKHYNHKVDVYSFAIVLWELLTNRMPFEGMSNLQAAYAAAFKNVRPTLADYHFPQELVFILQSCWAEDPNVRPNFAQVVRMLTAFLSSLPPPEKVPPPHVFASKIITTAKESSSSSSAIKDSPRAVVTDESTSLEGKSKLFQCFGHCFFSSAAGSLA